MAVTSLWRVKGWLGKLVIYVENPEKTKNPEYVKTQGQAKSLEDVIGYAMQAGKTQTAVPDAAGRETLHRFVSGVNCHPATAREEMIAVKKRFGKEDGTVAYHGYQSFAPGEATPQMAHEIGLALARRLWGEKYQVLVATHLDRENHLHNHFVLNTVSFVDGKKFHRTQKDYYEMQKASDELCREYGLSVIEDPRKGKSRHYGEWRAQQEQRPTWRGLVRADVDGALRLSMTERQFFAHLREKGYEIKTGKDISVRPPGKERFLRLARNFGEEYTIGGIRRRILSQERAVRPLPEPEKPANRIRLSGSLQNARKITGFRALYLHYGYLLGIFPKGRRQSPARLHFLLKEDLARLDTLAQEIRLLAGRRIDTAEQLSSYQKGLEDKIGALDAKRGMLRKKQRTVTVRADETKLQETKRQIAAITGELSALRKEVRLCGDIAMLSGVIRQKLKAVRQDGQKGKEKISYEQRRSRTGREIKP